MSPPIHYLKFLYQQKTQVAQIRNIAFAEFKSNFLILLFDLGGWLVGCIFSTYNLQIYNNICVN